MGEGNVSGDFIGSQFAGRAEAGAHKAVVQLRGCQSGGDAGEVRIARVGQRARRDQRLRGCRMSAVELVTADGNRALAHQGGLPVELSSLQQCQQCEGFDGGAGMHHATCGYVKMVSREDVPGLDIDNYGGCPAGPPWRGRLLSARPERRTPPPELEMPQSTPSRRGMGRSSSSAACPDCNAVHQAASSACFGSGQARPSRYRSCWAKKTVGRGVFPRVSSHLSPRPRDENVPQRLKLAIWRQLSARLKPCAFKTWT